MVGTRRLAGLFCDNAAASGSPLPSSRAADAEGRQSRVETPAVAPAQAGA